MLSFVVGDQSQATQQAVESAWLFGPDEISVPADLRLDDGVIRCEKHSAEPAGIALRVDQGLDTPLVLQTCLLPERDRPYALTLELARHRIMTILNKLEDWQLSDLAPTDPAMELFERARGAFTKALVSQGGSGDQAPDPQRTEELAREALRLAIDASEFLVSADTERAFEPRVNGTTYTRATARLDPKPQGQAPAIKNPVGSGLVLPGKPFIAAGISPARFSDDEIATVQSTSDFLALPLRWTDLEPDEGKYNFAPTDRWIEWAVRKAKLPVVAGPVIDFNAANAPDWLYIWEHDYETLREVVYEHIRHVVTRYRRTVPRWTIASGLHRNDNFVLSFEQMMDLTRMAVLLTRKLHPSARVQLELVQPFSGHTGKSPRSLPGPIYADMAAQSGVIADTYAVKLELTPPTPGYTGRDLMALSSTLDRYASLDRPIVVNFTSQSTAWSEPAAKQWLRSAIELTVSKSWLYAITWQQTLAQASDTTSGQPGRRAKPAELAGLTGADARPHPAISTLAAIRRSIREGKRDVDPVAVG